MSELELEITALTHDGRGIATSSVGKKIFVQNALPGEKVRALINRRKRSFDEGEQVAIIESSILRVDAPCKHADICGGCALQHLEPNAQLKAKEKQLAMDLQHFGNLNAESYSWVEPTTGPTTGYRTKARLGVKFVYKKDKVLVGFREARNSFLADLDECKTLHPKLAMLLPILKNKLYALNARDKIAQIEAAVGDDNVALIFRNLVDLCTTDKELLISIAKEYNFDLYLQPKGINSIHRIYNANGFETETLTYSLSDYNITLNFHPTNFTQVNTVINRKMLKLAISMLEITTEDNVLDLFCGLGNFSLPIAMFANKVVGVEGCQDMVNRATQNAANNQITNAQFYCHDLTKPWQDTPISKYKFDKVLLDPARSGADACLDLVANNMPKRIVYVSCNPATLARDAGILVNEYGYKMEKVGVLDMFPHTMHVESIALFTR